MLAARFVGGAAVTLEERPVPTPGAGEVLVRVDACALCGTDVHAYRRGSDVVPGHETAGTVVALGDGIDEPAIGVAGVVYLVDFCGSCYSCRHGWTNLCTDRRRMYGFTAPGGFAEYLVVRAACFLPVGDGVGADAATALLDLFGTTAHAFRRAGGTASAVGVLGCGPIGLGAIAVARAVGARRVHAVDVAPYRLKLAERIGAMPLDARDGDVVDRILDAEPDGCDVVIEAAGQRETQRQAIDIAAPGGRAVFVAHGAEPLELWAHADLIARERSLVGAEYFPIGEFERVRRLMARGLLDPTPLQTHRFPLERIDEACRTFWRGESGKVLVGPPERP
jgi:threonine 3-dehydrogenase